MDSQQGISSALEDAELSDESDDEEAEGKGEGGWCTPLTRTHRRLYCRALARGDPGEVGPLRAFPLVSTPPPLSSGRLGALYLRVCTPSAPGDERPSVPSREQRQRLPQRLRRQCPSDGMLRCTRRRCSYSTSSPASTSVGRTSCAWPATAGSMMRSSMSTWACCRSPIRQCTCAGVPACTCVCCSLSC